MKTPWAQCYVTLSPAGTSGEWAIYLSKAELEHSTIASLEQRRFRNAAATPTHVQVTWQTRASMDDTSTEPSTKSGCLRSRVSDTRYHILGSALGRTWCVFHGPSDFDCRSTQSRNEKHICIHSLWFCEPFAHTSRVKRVMLRQIIFQTPLSFAKPIRWCV